MARNIKDIQAEMYQVKEDEVALKELTSTSKTAIWRLFLYIFAYETYQQQLVFDAHRKNIEHIMKMRQPHTPRWYRNKALAFQYGHDLIVDSDEYNNTSFTEEQIQSSKIIKYCAIAESEKKSRLIVKIATENNGSLTPISDSERNAFQVYMEEIRDALIPITIINNPPDRLQLQLKIVIDRLILNSEGMQIIGGNYPVKEAISQFLKELPFDGSLSLQKLEEQILKVPGVKDLSLDQAKSSWIDAEANGNNNYNGLTAIDITKIPVSGYFFINFDEDNDFKTTIVYV